MDLIRQFVGEKELKMVEQESDDKNEIRVFKERIKNKKKFKMNLFKDGINFIPGIKIITKKMCADSQISSDAAIVLNDILNTVFNKFIKNKNYPDNMDKVIIDIMKDKSPEMLKHSKGQTRRYLEKISTRDISDKEKYERTGLFFPFSEINNVTHDLYRTVYISAVLEYIAAEILSVWEYTVNEGRKRITVEDIIMQCVFGGYRVRDTEIVEFIKKVGYRFEFL
jgi:hypothetical protein